MHYRKKPIKSPVTFAPVAGVLLTLEGPVAYQAGDALISGVAGERWPVERPRFEQFYLPVPPLAMGEDGLYVKKPAIVSARHLEAAAQLAIRHGEATLHGSPGDWIVTDENGGQWVVADEIFAATYQVLED